MVAKAQAFYVLGLFLSRSTMLERDMGMGGVFVCLSHTLVLTQN